MSDAPAGIDPRGPRFGAGITSLLLLVTVALGLTGVSTARATATSGWFAYAPPHDFALVAGAYVLPVTPLAARMRDPAFLLLLAVTLLFAWGVVSPRTAPWGAAFRRLVRPRLAPPAELEDPRPPRFAQGVGLLVAVIGLLLQVGGVPWGLPIAAAVAFVAAFLNAAFGFCLGCQTYLLLQRLGVVGRSAAA